MEQSIFIQLSERNKAYLQAIKEATELGYENAGALADEYGQFLVDASQDLRRRANLLEKLIEKCPDCKNAIHEMAKLFRDHASDYGRIYALWEQHQRKGIFPTNLPKIEGL